MFPDSINSKSHRWPKPSPATTLLQELAKDNTWVTVAAVVEVGEVLVHEVSEVAEVAEAEVIAGIAIIVANLVMWLSFAMCHASNSPSHSHKVRT